MYDKLLLKIIKDPQKFSKFRVSNDLMYKYIEPSLKNVTQDETNWKHVVPKNQRNKLIQLNHDSQKSGHLGIYKIYHRLLSNYYWPGMHRDVYDYIKRCTL